MGPVTRMPPLRRAESVSLTVVGEPYRPAPLQEMGYAGGQTNLAAERRRLRLRRCYGAYMSR